MSKSWRELRPNYFFLQFSLPALLAMGSLVPASAQTAIFNCSTFAATGACSVAQAGYPANFIVRNGGNLSGKQIDFVPANSGHNGYGLAYYTPVNVQAFTTSFTFIPNGQNFSFVVQNATTNPGYTGNIFSSGAGCEGGFYQAYGISPNNLFALEIDSGSWLTAANAAFTYSSVQIYQQDESPCLPNDGGANYVAKDKISTYPVPLNSPVNSQYTTTGDVYAATVTYNGTYLTLNMYDKTVGGSCPGTSCFTQSWPVNIPSLVTGNTAYIGFTAGINIPNLPALYVNSWNYTQGSATPAATPAFSLAGGTYTGPQSVTLSSISPGAVICYNTTGSPATNGASGCANGTLYTGAISVSSSETLFAVAGGAGYVDSAAASAAYTIGSATVATPTLSPLGGTYSSAQSLTISDATSGASIYYTTDGTTPTPSSTRYASPITVGSTETIKAIAVVPGDANSAVATAVYTINLSLPSAAKPVFSIGGGTYTSAQSVTISDGTPSATIYYTIDGTTPTTSSTGYTGPITVNATETLEAIAVAMGDLNSAVASAAYTINLPLPLAASPVISLPPGTYSSTQLVTLSDATPEATIYYTTDGAAPSTSSAEYTGPIHVNSTETLEAIAVAMGDLNSAVASAAYTISLPPSSVATPVFSLASGTYSSAQSVTIHDATAGAAIYYTTNGVAPSTASTEYTGTIAVSATETLQAIAVAQGGDNSAVASAAYTISPSTLPSPDFTLGTSSNLLTVDSGGQGTFTLTVTPENGFNSPVILACSGLPAGATCSFAQATVTPSGGAATTQVTISTSAQSAALHKGSRPFLPLTTLAMTVCLLGWRRRWALRQGLLVALAFASLGVLFGCASTGGGAGTSSPATTGSTTSTVALTGISGNLQGEATIMLTVK